MSELPQDKPVIHYPCDWEYRIIGGNPEQIRSAVAEILGEEDYTLEEGNWSRQGRWVSMVLRMVVINEPHRLETFRALREHPSVRMVL